MTARRKERPLRGTITVPGDKSLSHRALIFAALASGPSAVTGLNAGADTIATANCLAQLGTRLETEGDSVKIEPAPAGLREADAVLDAGNSGTTLRTLAGVCAGIHGLSVLTGDETLRRRPMLRVVAPLREMGASIDGREYGDKAPLAIRGGDLRPLDKDLSVSSAQVKTAILLAALKAAGTTTVGEPGPSRDHTEVMLEALGAPLRRHGRTTSLTGPWSPSGFTFATPGDISSAMFLIVAALLVPGSDLSITGLGLNQTRTGALDVLRSMGADIDWHVESETLGEPVGTVQARHSSLRGVSVGGSELIPRLIDEIPILAVAAACAEGRTVFADASELKLKESNRIGTVVDMLRTLGCEAEPTEDGLVVEGAAQLHGGEIASHGDHRIAMAAAVAGLVATGKVSVLGWSSVTTSFPGFLDVLGRARS